MSPRIASLLVILALQSAFALAQTASFAFIRSDSNQIITNNCDWSKLKRIAQMLTNADSTCTKLSILHIGDSHIQGGVLSEALRGSLQERYGNGGRGLIAPLKMVGTNQPADYVFTTANRIWQSAKLTSSKRRETKSITGVSARFASPMLSLGIGVNNSNDTFTSFTLLHSPAKGDVSANSSEMSITKTASLPYSTSFSLNSPYQKLSLYNLSGINELWGAILHNDRSGVVIHSIGNNGACYQHYNQIDNFASRTTLFAPHLIILSLGTNEAFGNCKNPDAIKREIDTLVSSLKESNPEAAILLTTPMECDRRQRSKRSSRRRRRRTSFVTNTNCLTIRNIIMQYGEEHNIAVWDLYTVAGGKGSATKWVANSLLAKRDHVHCSAEGYRLQGELLAKALIQSLTEE
ncbi:MAG: GDSL-type esterase/lipase family protein [Muribaculaceae bacterium]